MFGSHCSNQGRLPGGMQVVPAEPFGDEIVVAHVGADRAAEAVAVDFAASRSMPLSASASAAVMRVSGMFLSWPGKSASMSTVAPSSRPSGMPGMPVSRRMPLVPACIACQTASRSPPTAVTMPMPVITIRSSRSPLKRTICTRGEKKFWVESASQIASADAGVAVPSVGNWPTLRRSPCWQAIQY